MVHLLSSKTPKTLLPLILILGFCTQTWSQTDNRLADKKAIMETIQKETDRFYARDYAGWKDTYVHDKSTMQGWSNEDGTFDVNIGWETVNASIEKYIKENPVPTGKKRRVERRNLNYKFYGDLACYLTWDQYQENRDGNKFFYSKEIRIMEKQNGQWKIAGQAAFWDYKNLMPVEDLKPEKP